MRVDKVSIVITTVDEDHASVKLVFDPVPQEGDDIEDTPATMMGFAVWTAMQETIASMEGLNLGDFTLQ